MAAMLAMTRLLGITGALADIDRFQVIEGSQQVPGSILWDKYDLYDGATGNTVKPQGGTDYASSISNIRQGLQDGELGAIKDSFFENAADADKGIVKLTFDMVVIPPTDAVDVLVVLDESGSMTMYSNETNKYQYTVPCLNKDHYYKVQYFLDNNQSILYTYDLYPSRFTHTNVWTNTQFISEVKAAIPTQENIPVSRITMFDRFIRDYGEIHCHNDAAGNPVKIDKNVPAGLTSAYYSPSAATVTATGCFDRQIVAKTAIKEILDLTNKSNSASRFRWVSFAGDVVTTREMENNINIPGLNQRNGYDDTNCVAALNRALTMLRLHQNTKPAGRETIVIFVTDGSPTKGGTSETVIIPIADEIKRLSDTTLYTIGIKSGASSLLQAMATPGCFMDCESVDDLSAYLAAIGVAISGKHATLTDTIGSEFDVYCDRSHPISVQKEVNTANNANYYTLEEARNNGINYDPATHNLQWSGDGIHPRLQRRTDRQYRIFYDPAACCQ